MNIDVHTMPVASVFWGWAILASFIYAMLMARRMSIELTRIFALMGIAWVCAILGAKLGWITSVVLGEGSWSADTVRELLLRWDAGYSSLGAMAGAAAGCAVIFSLGWKQSEIRRMVDILVAGGLCALSIARLGCHFQGCDFGRRTDALMAIHYPTGSSAWLAHFREGLIGIDASWSLGVHPFALYLSVSTAIVVLFGTFALSHNKLPAGECAWFMTLAYLVLRLFVEFVREPTTTPMAVLGLSVHQVLVLAAIIGVYVLGRHLHPERDSSSEGANLSP